MTGVGVPMEKIPQLEVGQHRITQQRILKVSYYLRKKKKFMFAEVHTNGGEFGRISEQIVYALGRPY